MQNPHNPLKPYQCTFAQFTIVVGQAMSIRELQNLGELLRSVDRIAANASDTAHPTVHDLPYEVNPDPKVSRYSEIFRLKGPSRIVVTQVKEGL